MIALAHLNDRLAPFRYAEATALESLSEELAGLAKVVAPGDRRALARALIRYHRRRVAAATTILAHLTDKSLTLLDRPSARRETLVSFAAQSPSYQTVAWESGQPEKGGHRRGHTPHPPRPERPSLRRKDGRRDQRGKRAGWVPGSAYPPS